MNLRKAKSYSVGLDLGTASVGWAVTDLETGELLHFKGKPTWGSRLFPSAETAATTRQKRSQRRRYVRRRQRIEYLQSFFLDSMREIDPEFFVRLNQSRLYPEDRNAAYSTEYLWPLFNETDFTEPEYYKRFPTIWHLRKHLMESSGREDIRLVYLALHNIVKYRGNFLQEDNKDLRAANANAHAASRSLAAALSEYFDSFDDECGISCSPSIGDVRDALDERDIGRQDRISKLAKAFGISDAKVAKELAKACIGLKAEFSKIAIGMEKQEGSSAYLWDDDKLDSLMSVCPDDFLPVIDAARAAYSSYILSDLLAGESCISSSFIAAYEQHGSDLRVVKDLVRDHLGLAEYRRLFRGPKNPDGSYDINKLPKSSYTSYILGDKLCNGAGTDHEALIKELRRVFEGSPTIQADERYLAIKNRLEGDDKFLAKQKSRANGAIPYQLHLEEMDRIIDMQSRFYPFLGEHCAEIEKAVSSRIPYYVGPLNGGHDPDGEYPGNVVDKTRKFAWSVRKDGMEGVRVYPWNVEDVIDVDETAERFICRMTGTCTYLYGEPVVPRCSLLYEEFCVLNELNGARWSEGERDTHRFDYADRERIFEEVFKSRKTVSHRAVSQWLERNRSAQNVKITGTQGETGFESKLSSYNDFCKILGVDDLEEGSPLSRQDIEQIILWSTVFEDRSILQHKVVAAYGSVLSEKQIKSIVRKRYTGWGRLSEKFLSGLKIETHLGAMSIMDILHDGDPRTGNRRQAMNLMEILREKDFDFQQKVDSINKENLRNTGNALSVEDLPGSPALRRSVNQAMRILEEIESIAGKAPDRIVIEVTRDDDEKKKGKRSRTRYDKLKESIESIRRDALDFDPDLVRELSEKKGFLDSERLVLYFVQCGKSLYSGRPLDINRLSEYQVDHIIPQCYIKDDSLDNKALVLANENQRKLDSLLLDQAIVNSQRRRWQELHRVGLISDKKYRNLTCTSISDRMMTGFINRQLVETSQVVKFVRQMCEQKYSEADVISLRASLTHGLRERCDLVKCRELNDYHHAHDAYLACQMARFIAYRYPTWQDGFDRAIINRYVKELAKRGRATGQFRVGKSGFIVDSFMRDGFDKETGEIFKDEWNASLEVGRIRRSLNYKDCFISRMPEERTGAFWEETIYSPCDVKNGQNLSTPLKESGREGHLDPKRYGGTNTVFNAYFFAFAAKDKKGRDKYFFEGVPVHLAKRVRRDKEALLHFAESIAAKKDCSDVRILRPKVPLRQKFLLDGTEFYLGGRTSANNDIRAGKQFCPDQEMGDVISIMSSRPNDISDESYVEAFDAVVKALRHNCPLLSDAIKADEYFEAYANAPKNDRAKVVLNLLASANGKKAGCDLRLVGGKQATGVLFKNLASLIDRIVWIDQSVTGMFETKHSFEDLKNGL